MNILDSLSWRSDPKVQVHIQVLENTKTISMTAIDLIACGLFENDAVLLKSKIIQIVKGDHQQNDEITLYIPPIDAFNLAVSSGDQVWIERGNFKIHFAEKVEIKRFWEFPEEIILEMENSIQGKIIREGDLLEIDFHQDKGTFRENVLPKFKDMKDFPVLKTPTKRGYVQIGAINGAKSDYDGFLIDTKKTAIIVKGWASSRLPPYINQSLVDVLNENSAFVKISGLVKACFSKKYPLFTILLYGKQGVGKTTLITAIAESLGVLLVRINFLNLLNDDKTEMIARLEIEVEQAMETAPVILCLENIDVFLRDSMHKGI